MVISAEGTLVRTRRVPVLYPSCCGAWKRRLCAGRGIRLLTPDEVDCRIREISALQRFDGSTMTEGPVEPQAQCDHHCEGCDGAVSVHLTRTVVSLRQGMRDNGEKFETHT
jgi:hypothetical protein